VSLVVVGCDRDGKPASSASAPATPAVATASLPADLIATTPPDGAQDVSAVKKTAKDGDAVVVRGKIGGSEQPIAKNRALMTILDASLKTCDTIPGDKCPTPWDACCESSEARAANSATVQVVGTNGKPLTGTLENAGGIKPLKNVIVAGIVRIAPGDVVDANAKPLVIEAKQIYVTP
jgi:hypothetical protein